MYRFITSILALFLITLDTGVSHAGQDPMRPPSWFGSSKAVPTVKSKINLQQVLVSDNRRIAIINNMILKEGDAISGIKILTIESNRIKVRQAGIEKYISLLPTAKEVNSEI